MKKLINRMAFCCRKAANACRRLKWRARIKYVGKDFSVSRGLTVVAPYNLSIGDHCSINPNVYINAYNPVTIGNDVSIATGVSIVSADMEMKKWADTGVKTHVLSKDHEIVIGDHVLMATKATILAGVHIEGEYVVIAAGAVVTRSIYESRCIVAGCPAKIIKYF